MGEVLVTCGVDRVGSQSRRMQAAVVQLAALGYGERLAAEHQRCYDNRLEPLISTESCAVPAYGASSSPALARPTEVS